MPAVALSLSDPEQRVEQRSFTRNLENFLSSSFAPGKLLSLTDKNIYGHAVKCLKEVDKQQLSWLNYPWMKWQERMCWQRAAEHVSEYASAWQKIVAEDPKKEVALERQCALFERSIKQYNQEMLKSDPKSVPIAFSNPLKKVLNVIIHYPPEIGHPPTATASHPIYFDRLTTAAELKSQFKAVLKKPVVVIIKGDKDRSNAEKTAFSFSVVSEHIFKQQVQIPDSLFDPSDDRPRPNMQEVHITYDDHDWHSVGANLYILGQNESLSRVYQQGKLDGRREGYIDAMEEVKAAFSQ